MRMFGQNAQLKIVGEKKWLDTCISSINKDFLLLTDVPDSVSIKYICNTAMGGEHEAFLGPPGAGNF